MLVKLATPSHDVVVVNTEDISSITNGAVDGYSMITFMSATKPVIVNHKIYMIP